MRRLTIVVVMYRLRYLPLADCRYGSRSTRRMMIAEAMSGGRSVARPAPARPGSHPDLGERGHDQDQRLHKQRTDNDAGDDVQLAGTVYSLREPAAPLLPDKRESLLANVASESDRLVRFVADALALTRLENAPPVHLEWNDLGEVVWASLARCEPLLGSRPITLAVSNELPLARFDAGLLDQAVTALLENVAAHTPTDSPVWIEGEAQGGEVRLAICDAGPRIPAIERERILAKYERLDTRRPGVGLGLAVARAAIQVQGGRSWAEASPYGGARLVIGVPHVAVRRQPA
jgi:K+-sensing histidine kinase KdpD